MCFEDNRRNGILEIRIDIRCITAKRIVLPSKRANLFSKLVHLYPLLVLPIPASSAACVPPILEIGDDGYEKAREEQASGKSKNERNDPLEKSNVQHKPLPLDKLLTTNNTTRFRIRFQSAAACYILTLLPPGEKFSRKQNY